MLSDQQKEETTVNLLFFVVYIFPSTWFEISESMFKLLNSDLFTHLLPQQLTGIYGCGYNC